MKSYGSSSSDSDKPDRFLAYMVPSLDEVEFSQIFTYATFNIYFWSRLFDLFLVMVAAREGYV